MTWRSASAGRLAKHAALGYSVGLCDLTRGEMSSNGTPEERVKEAEQARNVLGAVWRENLGLPDRAIGSTSDHIGRVVDLIRRARPRTVAIPYWQDRHPDHEAAARLLQRRCVQREARAIRGRRRSLAARLGLPLLHQRRGSRVVPGRRLGVLRKEEAGTCLLCEPVLERIARTSRPG